jgi:hypothetical protein
MTVSRLAAATLAIAAALAAPAIAAEGRLYQDQARGFSTLIPEGWSDPSGGLTTSSPDGSVSCTITAQPVSATASMSQDAVNASMQVYTAEVWRDQFFRGGAEGVIETSGITRLEQFDAPWARGTITYPGHQLAKFGVLLVQAPGKLASVTCTGEPIAYEKNLRGLSTVLNYLRPL